MGLTNLLTFAAKPMRRVLKGGKVIEYSKLKDGTRLTKLYDRYGACYLEKTSKVVKNNNTRTRYVSEISRFTQDCDGKPIETTDYFFKHIKMDRFYDSQGNLLKANKLIEKGNGTPALRGGYCRMFDDVSLTTQKPNGSINTIMGEPNVAFEYTKKLDTSPTIWD